MLDHLIITVSDFDASSAFYRAALEPLGYQVVLEAKRAIGLGIDGKPEVFIRELAATAPPVHIAVRSPDRPSVDRFHEAALAAGGTDNGPPGLRAGYHPSYYAAFVLDPDGHNIEAVCHAEPDQAQG